MGLHGRSLDLTDELNWQRTRLDALRSCDWNNTTDQVLTFPRKMCVGVGFSSHATADITCVDGV